MVDEKTAKKLIGNLKGLDGFPETEWQRAQLGKALMQHCPTAEHADRTLEACLREQRFCPTVDRIIGAAKSLPRDTEASRRRENCHECKGSGWVPGLPVMGLDGRMVSTVKRCECVGGA